MARQRERVTTPLGSEVKTKQSFKNQCDINDLVARHRRTGLVDHTTSRKPLYGDFTAATDLFTHINATNAAEDEFRTLPAQVRRLCNEDPVELLNLLATEPGCESLRTAGLVVTDEPSNPPLSEAPSPEGTAPDPVAE